MHSGRQHADEGRDPAVSLLHRTLQDPDLVLKRVGCQPELAKGQAAPVLDELEFPGDLLLAASRQVGKAGKLTLWLLLLPTNFAADITWSVALI
ncbi:uncharacterized protein EMH_0086490 [Eimeria mitis]|uniref:Uncharacterized protein n=1 Tax=Eimeria mitis TaxID=44415 RepID=U6KEL2_9EIME|nr:uncharacterized protein EMH_0086490 [Eimeria mitis]CDJ36460.1 hypothetical protein EMH_0086490 [Eimeria mitis]